MQGRITERQFPLAEKCFPGIRRFYDEMPVKPATFLQLVWAFEARKPVAPARTRRAAPRRKA